MATREGQHHAPASQPAAPSAPVSVGPCREARGASGHRVVPSLPCNITAASLNGQTLPVAKATTEVCLWGTMCVTDDAWWSGVLHRLEHLSHPSGRDLCFRMREVPDLGIARIPSANGIGGPVPTRIRNPYRHLGATSWPHRFCTPETTHPLTRTTTRDVRRCMAWPPDLCPAWPPARRAGNSRAHSSCVVRESGVVVAPRPVTAWPPCRTAWPPAGEGAGGGAAAARTLSWRATSLLARPVQVPLCFL